MIFFLRRPAVCQGDPGMLWVRCIPGRTGRTTLPWCASAAFFRATEGDGRVGDARADRGAFDRGGGAVGAICGGRNDGAGDRVAGAGGAAGDDDVPRAAGGGARGAGAGVQRVPDDGAGARGVGGACGAVRCGGHRVRRGAAAAGGGAVSRRGFGGGAVSRPAGLHPIFK